MDPSKRLNLLFVITLVVSPATTLNVCQYRDH
jgi:hypothetical protein